MVVLVVLKERNMFERASITNLAQILAIAAVGSLAAQIVTLPLTGLFLSAFAVILLRKRFHHPLRIPKTLLMFIQVVLGISVGATISIAELAHTISVPVIVGLVICLMLQTGCSFWWLHKREGWNPFESLLAAVPGAMAAILVISESESKPSPKVVYAHSVRLIILIILAGIVSSNAAEVVKESITLDLEQWSVLAGIVAISMVSGKLSVRFGIPAPYMIASLVIAAACNGIMAPVSIAVPVWLVLFSTSLLGVLIGARLAETTLREAVSYSKAGVMVTIIGMSVAIVTSYIASLLLSMPWMVMLLSWVPGSVEAMTAVALLLGLEPAFVMVNHAIRLLLLYTLPALLKNKLEALRHSES